MTKTDWKEWIDIATNSPFSGSYSFTDPQATNFNRRFCRVLIR